MVAVDLYKNKKVSLGYCAEVAEMSKEEFVKCLGQNGVSIFGFDSDEEFMEELANA
jgi:predicted HTH domain antitoxin